VQVAPSSHYTVGGLKVDVEGRTNLPKVYAVGEIAGGVHGANRHGGTALVEAITFGRIAGRHAARSLNGNAKRTSASLLPPERKAGAPARVVEAMAKLRHTNKMALGPIRDRGRLERVRRDAGSFARRARHHALRLPAPGDAAPDREPRHPRPVGFPADEHRLAQEAGGSRRGWHAALCGRTALGLRAAVRPRPKFASVTTDRPLRQAGRCASSIAKTSPGVKGMKTTKFASAIDERYFEDYIVGSVYEFGDFAVTESEVIGFAKQFDPQYIHTDPCELGAAPIRD